MTDERLVCDLCGRTCEYDDELHDMANGEHWCDDCLHKGDA